MRVVLSLTNRWGRPETAELLIRRDVVELRCREGIVGCTDRDLLHDWLQAPQGTYEYDEVAWLAVGNGVALAVADTIPAWVLADDVLDELSGQI